MGEIEKDLAHLESLLRLLEKEYDKFLSGQERREPAKTEAAVQALLHTHGTRPIQNLAMAFKFNSLSARYNSLKTVWTRRLREREEGRGPGAPRPPVPAPVARPPRLEYIARDPSREGSRLEHLFDTYRHLRKECGEATDKLRVEGFQRALAEKVQKIKEAHGVDAVLIRISAEGGKTRIVAKPFRRKPVPPPRESP